MVGHGFGVLPALLRGKQVALELGQLAGALERIGVDGIGHIALGVAMLLRLHVQHELRQRPVQARQRPLHDREARARELDAHVKVQAQRRADIDMVLGLKGKNGRRAPAAHLDVVGFAGAHGHAFVWQVGHRQQQALQLGLDLLQARSGLLQLGFGRCHLGLGGLGTVLVALAHQHADLLGQLVALRLQFFGAGLQRLAFGFQRLEGGHVQKRLWVFAGLQAFDGAGQVFAEKKDVKHGAILGEHAALPGQPGQRHPRA